MGSSNFKQFNPNAMNMLNDSDYNSSTYRLNGVVPGIGPSAPHNKLFYQVSTMVAAIGQVLADAGKTVSDSNLTSLIADLADVFIQNPQLPKGYMNGVVPVWQSASTVRIPAGFICRDADDTTDMNAAGNLDAVLSVSGAGGLDTGSEASNSTYYLWFIEKSSDGAQAAMFSLSPTSPTMPVGYDIKRRMKGAWRNNASSNLLKMQYGAGYPYRPLCLYDVPMTIATTPGATNIGNTASTSYASYDCTAYAPEAITKTVLLHVSGNSSNSALLVRPGDEASTAQQIGLETTTGGGQRGFSDLIRIDSADGTIDAALTTASGTQYLDVKGFVDTLGD